MAVQVSITFTVPTQAEVDDLATYLGWVSGGPLTKSQVIKNYFISQWKLFLKRKRENDTIPAAQQSIDGAVDALSIT